METPVFCTDNLFDDLLYTSHTVTANEEGTEAWHVANNRRSPSDYWTPTTANNDAWVEVACDRVRSADFVAIDRGHNLAGKTVALQVSDDDFTTTESVFSITFPSSYGHGSLLSATNGARTEEGAWVKSFDLRAAKYWRLHITAAASFTPKVVGLWVGKMWDPGEYVDRPWDEDGSVGAFEAAGNDLGWSAYTTQAAPRQGQVSLRLSNFYADDASRRFLDLYRRGRPAWYVPQQDRAERAGLVKVPQGARIEAPYEAGWGYRTVRLPYVEHEPRIVE